MKRRFLLLLVFGLLASADQVHAQNEKGSSFAFGLLSETNFSLDRHISIISRYKIHSKSFEAGAMSGLGIGSASYYFDYPFDEYLNVRGLSVPLEVYAGMRVSDDWVQSSAGIYFGTHHIKELSYVILSERLIDSQLPNYKHDLGWYWFPRMGFYAEIHMKGSPWSLRTLIGLPMMGAELSYKLH